MAIHPNQTTSMVLLKALRLIALCCAGVAVGHIASAQPTQTIVPKNPAASATQAKPPLAPQTVTDFYMLLPGSMNDVRTDYEAHSFLFYLEDERLNLATTRAHRRSLIAIEDVKNGYIKLQTPDWLAAGLWMEIAKFTTKAGASVMGVSQLEQCDGPKYQLESCDGGLVFLKYADQKWMDVSDQVFPAQGGVLGNNSSRTIATSRYCHFALPRQGTDLRMVCRHYGEKGKSAGKTFTTSEKRFAWNGAQFIAR